ncbi:MAG TPA: succinate dehydrogenase, hydrophobic membrane anchor protein [Burkholderiaceae bacterium]|jgi:succinate dehydrogenase / fumarate reductase membrane anchor subunit|nr:succinate dehydrogenase, hydrophobic membrane anchor protein [Burkholderiaceae bacterium]
MAIGSKRLVVGAHYGLKDWLAQRITAVVLAVYAVFFVLYSALRGGDAAASAYEAWARLFAPVWMKVATLIEIAALVYHAWIGMRDIWMDYIKPTGVRLALQVATVLWLAFCAVWAAQILWRV